MAVADDEPVWYAAYGSNCDPRRFLAYLIGGAIPGGRGHQVGARDPSPPRATGPCRFDRQVVFTGSSRRWGGGYAFLGHDRVVGGALGRCHLITIDQFVDVLDQENGRSPSTSSPEARRRAHIVDAIRTLEPGVETIVGDGPYDALVALHPADTTPVVTFTHPTRPEALTPAAPSAAYLTAIVTGLVAVHEMPPRAIAERLVQAPGMAPTWTVEAVEALAARPVAPENESFGP